MNIYTSDNRTGKAAMCQLQKLIARKYPARVSTEGRQQVQFRARQTDANAVRVEELARGRFQPPAGEVKRFRQTCRPGLIALRAPKEGANARDQFTRTEWLGDIVVRTDLKTDNTIHSSPKVRSA